MTFLETTREYALELDRNDELGHLRSQFHIPCDSTGRELVYFVGNSLGLQPKGTAAAVSAELNAWAERGVEAHFQGKIPWTHYPELLGSKMGELVGAVEDEIVMMNGLTVNLHLMMVSFYRPSGRRRKIVIESHAFPSDKYAVASQTLLHGHDPADVVVELKPRSGEHVLRTEDVVQSIRDCGEETELVLLGGVNYYTGQYFDLEAVTAAAHEVGATAGFDLAHAVGNVYPRLHAWNVDFAVWCSYKYLNAGPGGIAGCFVHERHRSRDDLPRLAGWWGEDVETRFRMLDQFQPMPGAGGWQLSNPSVLSFAALRTSLDIFSETGAERLLAKQRHLTGFLEYLLRQGSTDHVDIITPRSPTNRGSQLSLLTSGNGKRLYESLRRAGFVCDWRDPDVIRVAPVPMYNTFAEVWDFAEALSNN